MADQTGSDGRGVLYPGALPTFHRESAPPHLRELIRWFWIPRWDLAPGRVSRQQILPFPTSNLVVEPHGVSLSGPTTGISHRDLRGRGWAVGALLRPAAVASLCDDPSMIHDREVPLEAPTLLRDVSAAMQDASAAGRSAAVRAYGTWASERFAEPNEVGRLANAMEDLISTDRRIIRVGQVAERLSVSVRSLQRLAQRYVGLTPLSIIRRYRLQEAAQRLREDPTLTIAQTAADLGYADHAHLSADFRHVLGFSPRSYREAPDTEP